MAKKIFFYVTVVTVVVLVVCVCFCLALIYGYEDQYERVDFSMYDHEWIIGKTESEVVDRYGEFDFSYQYESSPEYISYYKSDDVFADDLVFGITFNGDCIAVECAKYYTEWEFTPYEILSTNGK